MTDLACNLIKEKVDTVEKVLRFSANKHGQKNALGTRQILAQEEEEQPNGRVLKKVCQHFLFSPPTFIEIIFFLLFIFS